MKKRIYKVCYTLRLEETLAAEIDTLADESHTNRSSYVEAVLREHIHAVARSRDYDFEQEVR